MGVRTQRTPKTIASWSGSGKLLKDEDPVAQVEYALRVWKDQEPFEEADASYFSSGTFEMMGYEPDIEEGAELLLELQDGRLVSVVIQSYDLGRGAFQLSSQSLEKLFVTGSSISG